MGPSRSASTLLVMAALVRAPVYAQSTEASDIHVAIAARSVQPGELVVLTITSDAPLRAVRVDAFGRSIHAYEDHDRVWRALIGIDLEQRPGTYTADVQAETAGAARRKTERLVVLPKKFAVRTLRVAPEFVSPSPSDLARIEREAQFVEAQLARVTPERSWEFFVRPVSDPANSRFGTRSVFNGERRRPHGGTDFLSPAGTPVKAPASGQVVAARELFFTGNTVMIDHGLGLVSMLAHLSRIDVHEGDRVSTGQIVGLVGATGRVTGPHLHWALSVDRARVDPLSAVALLTTPPPR